MRKQISAVLEGLASSRYTSINEWSIQIDGTRLMDDAKAAGMEPREYVKKTYGFTPKEVKDKSFAIQAYSKSAKMNRFLTDYNAMVGKQNAFLERLQPDPDGFTWTKLVKDPNKSTKDNLKVKHDGTWEVIQEFPLMAIEVAKFYVRSRKTSFPEDFTYWIKNTKYHKTIDGSKWAVLPIGTQLEYLVAHQALYLGDIRYELDGKFSLVGSKDLKNYFRSV